MTLVWSILFTTLYICIDDKWNYVDVGDDNSHQIVITCSLQDFSDRLHHPFVTMTAWSQLCVEITEKSLQTDCAERKRNNKYSTKLLPSSQWQAGPILLGMTFMRLYAKYVCQHVVRCSSIIQRLFISVVCFGCISKGRGEISCKMLTRSSFSLLQPNSSLTATLLSTMSFWQVAFRVKHRPIRQTLPQFTVLAALHV